MGVEKLISKLNNHSNLLLDTNVVIYYLDDIMPYSEVLETVFDQIQRGHIQAYISVISVSEIMVKPMREKNERVINQYLTFFHYFPNLTIAEVTHDVSLQAAHIRAETGIKLPDALILATAIINNCAILGNDAAWAVKNIPVPFFLLKNYSFRP